MNLYNLKTVVILKKLRISIMKSVQAENSLANRSNFDMLFKSYKLIIR